MNAFNVGHEPTNADLLIYMGDDFTMKIVISSADGKPADLTGMTAAAQIRGKASDESPVYAEFVTAVDPATGTVTLTLDHDATRALPVQTLVWDAQLTSATGIIATVVRGYVQVLADVTRPLAPSRSGAAEDRARLVGR